MYLTLKMLCNSLIVGIVSSKPLFNITGYYSVILCKPWLFWLTV